VQAGDNSAARTKKHKTCAEFYALRTLKSRRFNSRGAKRDWIILVHRRALVWKNDKDTPPRRISRSGDRVMKRVAFALATLAFLSAPALATISSADLRGRGGEAIERLLERLHKKAKVVVHGRQDPAPASSKTTAPKSSKVTSSGADLNIDPR
jgi:hypothetical protein